jgi:uncharacterized repeat protein (TIGR03803 family)
MRKSKSNRGWVIFGTGLLLMNGLRAQTLTPLYSFSAASGTLFTNSDGVKPSGELILSSNTLYGSARNGGLSGNGTVFRLNTDGTGFTNLHNFTVTSGPLSTNSDGANPFAGLVMSGNFLYGTAANGGRSGNGTVFKLNTDGTGFTNLYTFSATSGPLATNSDGASPIARLLLVSNTLYGVARYGGSSGIGIVFALNTNGTVFTNLHVFAAGIGSEPVVTNSDGAFPDSALIWSGTTLYGSASYGGTSAEGVVFAINTNGGGFTNLYNFTTTSNPFLTNSDGSSPHGLILSGNRLYGTAGNGGATGYGTVFSLNTNGTGFTNLHSFPSAANSTNSDGAGPARGLILFGNTLYGTALIGGSFNNGPGTTGNGTIFSLNTNGMAFTNLHNFSPAPGYTNSDGYYPNGGMVLSSNIIYGATDEGGIYGNGVIFAISLPPLLTIIHSGANVILVWPTNAVGFNLQSRSNSLSPQVWAAVSPAPVVVNGQNTVTNPASGTQKFYRLSQ